MELVVEHTKEYKEDIRQVTVEERKVIDTKISAMAGSLLNGKTAFFDQASKPYIFKLKHGAESSLYVLRVGNNQRAIASVDEDPLFDKINLTLYRLVDRDKADEVYKEVGTGIYNSENLME